MIYDTAVDGLIIETDLCSSCNSASAFNTTTSGSYVKTNNNAIFNLEDDYKYYNYTKAYNSTESVYLSHPNISATAFPFMALAEQDGKVYPEVDGILGFSRQSDKGNNPLYLEFVKNSAHISKEQIAFYMDTHDGTNYVDVGAYNPSSIIKSMY